MNKMLTNEIIITWTGLKTSCYQIVVHVHRLRSRLMVVVQGLHNAWDDPVRMDANYVKSFENSSLHQSIMSLEVPYMQSS